MNNYKEAKSWLGELQKNPSWTLTEINWPAVDQLCELVDREMPKKPIKHKTRKYKTQPFIWVCPNCDKALPLWFDEEPNEVDTYCGCCGQHLDWSE